MDQKIVRPIILVVIVATALCAYVFYRRGIVNKHEAAAKASSGEQPGDRDMNVGRNRTEGGDAPQGVDDDRGPGEGDNPEYGVEPGVPDPQGQPGTMGPRSKSVCIRKTPTSQTHSRFQVSGTATLNGTVRVGKRGVTTIIATDTPVSKWHEVPRVQVYETLFTKKNEFRLDFRAPTRKVQLCAIRTEDYQEFTYVHVAGCVEAGLAARADGASAVIDNLNIEMIQQQNTLELIGFSVLVPGHAWSGTQQRHVTGKVTVPGKDSGNYLVAVADFPILEQPDAETNPSALYVTAADGTFDIRFLSPPGAALHVCALGLPAAGTDIKKLTHLWGSGCTKVSIPGDAPPAQPLELPDIQLQIDGRRQQELTGHEQEHFDFLARCLSDWTAQ